VTNEFLLLIAQRIGWNIL